MREENERYVVVLFDEAYNVLLTSQYREMKPMCMNEISWIRTSGMKDSLYEREISEDGRMRALLHANDAHVLGMTPWFETEEDLDACVEAINRVCADAELDDRTPEFDKSFDLHGVLQEHARDVVAGKA